MMGKEEAVDYSKTSNQYLFGRLSKTTKIIRIANCRSGFHTCTSEIMRNTQLLGYFLLHKMEKCYSQMLFPRVISTYTLHDSALT
jgi:hypothetical protein